MIYVIYFCDLFLCVRYSLGNGDREKVNELEMRILVFVFYLFRVFDVWLG